MAHGRCVENILILEARSALRAIERLAACEPGRNLRQLLLVDNLGLALSMDRCRSKNFKLLAILRRVSSLRLCKNIRLAVRWIPSEANPADAPSRIYEPGGSSKPLAAAYAGGPPVSLPARRARPMMMTC